MKTKIEVEINKIKVEKGYFCFKYGKPLFKTVSNSDK